MNAQPQKLESYKSFKINTIDSKYRKHFIVDNEGYVHLTIDAVMNGHWDENKVMKNVDNYHNHIKRIATHNQVVMYNLQKHLANK